MANVPQSKKVNKGGKAGMGGASMLEEEDELEEDMWLPANWVVGVAEDVLLEDQCE